MQSYLYYRDDSTAQNEEKPGTAAKNTMLWIHYLEDEMVPIAQSYNGLPLSWSFNDDVIYIVGAIVVRDDWDAGCVDGGDVLYLSNVINLYWNDWKCIGLSYMTYL